MKNVLKSLFACLFMASAVLPAFADGTINVATGASGAGWTYSGNVFTINTSGAYTLNGTTTDNRVEVAAGVTAAVTFDNLTITSDDAAFSIAATSNVTVTLSGTNALTGGGTSGTGPALEVVSGATLVIEGDGSLNAVGSAGAGIGCAGYNGLAAGTITINGGTIYAESKKAASIGGQTGTIIINGGVVTTKAPIGKPGIGGTNFTMNGNGVVFATVINDASAKASGIVFKNKVGTAYGSNITPTQSFTIPAGNSLEIEPGQIFTVSAGKTLTNEGTVSNYGTINIDGSIVNNGTITNYNVINGTVTGNAVVVGEKSEYTIDLSTVNSSGEGYTFSDNTLTLTKDKAYYTLTGTAQKNIVVAGGILTYITLQDVNVESSRAFYIASATNATTIVSLTLEGTNSLKSTASGNAGLGVPGGTTLTIDGKGSLLATGYTDGADACGAGIGAAAGKEQTAGTININGGIVTAVGYDKAASIGGGYHSTGGTLNVSGGVVTAITGRGIGNYNGSGGNLNISGNGIVFVNVFHNSSITSATGGVVFLAGECTFYGNITTNTDFTLPAGYTLTIPTGKTVTVSEGTNFTNNGTTVVAGSLIIDGEATNNSTLTINGTATINADDLLTNERDGVINIFGGLTNNGQLVNRGVINGTVTGNQPFVETYTIDVSTVTGDGPGYTVSGDVITLTIQDAIYVLTGTTTSKIVEVAPNINSKVKFSNLNITSADNAFSINSSSVVTLTLDGANTLKSTGGTALNEASDVSLTIIGTGSLTAEGNTVGIGGATTIINDGYVTATGTNGISGTFKMEGNAVVFASSVTDNSSKTNGVLFIGNDGKLYGAEVTPDFNYTIPTGKVLTIDNAKLLTVPTGKTVTNNGTIHVYGTLDVKGAITNNGTIYNYSAIEGIANISGNAVQTGTLVSYNIDLSVLNPGVISGPGYTYSGGTSGIYTLTENNAEYVIYNSTTTKRVAVAAGVSVKVKLQNASIVVSQPFYINPLGIVTLELVGDNTLKSTTAGKAALGVPVGAKVIIDGAGSLDAQSTAYGSGGTCGAGIGGDTEKVAGTIIINNGTINTKTIAKAAGIGGGYHAGYKEIIINGGFITAGVQIFAGTQGDGIGGYGNENQVELGTLSIKNAVVFSSYTRDKKEHENSLVFDDRIGVIYGTSAVIDRDITLPAYGIMTVKSGQTLTINAGATLTIPTTSVLTIESGANLVVNGNISGAAQSTYLAKSGANITNPGNISITNIDYDYRDRLYLGMHILKSVNGGSVINEAGVAASIARIEEFERFMEGLFPNINVVTIIDTLSTSVGANKLPHAINAYFQNKDMGSAAGLYYSNMIEIKSTSGGSWGVGALVHEYYHHTTNFVTASDPDDGRSFDQLYQDWSDLRSNQFVQLITNANDIGEAWNGDDNWLIADPKTQKRPECTFPDFVNIPKGGKLSQATFSGESGDGTFYMTNANYVPKTAGETYAMSFRPTDEETYHIVTKEVQIRFAGELLPITITVSQSDIPSGSTPAPVYSITPNTLQSQLIVEYKLQASFGEFSATVPTEDGAYTVRVSFPGNDTYEPGYAMANFNIGTTAIEVIDVPEEQVKIASGEGFIKIISENGVNKSQLVRVYTITGTLYASKYLSNSEEFIPAKKGLYVVNCGTTRKKVVVR
jgi:hypothetical protein